MSRAKKGAEEPKKLVQGDDAIESFEADWFDFRTRAIELAKQLYTISKSSGVCCGIVGPWGSGKSSFMKLMDEYIRKESSWKNVHIAWFTAWDPGGIQDLGDAMLYHFFRDIAEKNREIAGAFKELQEALGIRRGLRERARRVLEGVSETLPTTGRAAATVVSGLLGELDAPRKVQKSFQMLMDWLDKGNRTVFFFIDDIDRATGDQIRDLLSELKLYISHRRIVAVLGYDEEYVLGALESPVLPPGIDPKKYLEKIVTIRSNVPIPTPRELAVYATRLIRSLLDLHEDVGRLGGLAASLSFNNPRRLKNLVLAFTQFLSSLEYKKFSIEHYTSLLIVSAAVNLNFLADDKIRETMDSGTEEDIVTAIEEFVKKDSTKSKEAELLIRAVQFIEPRFMPGVVSQLRLSGAIRTPTEEELIERRGERFDWSVSLFPILSSAATRGFKAPPDAVESSGEVIIPPSTKTESLDVKTKEQPEICRRLLWGMPKRNCALSWNQSHMIVLLTSSFLHPRQGNLVIDSFFAECAHFVAEKGFILWIIDDQNLFNEKYSKELVERAQKISKGLKHQFTLQYTLSSKVVPLLTFLLGISSARGVV